MRFYNNQTQQILQYQNQPQQQRQQGVRVQMNSKPVSKQVEVQTTGPKRMKWGEPTWYLFHTLAQKVKEESFPQIRMELLQNIAMICTNLPCPICSEHATQYIKKIPFYSIQTKQGLKDMLYIFHNEVNNNKKFPQFPYEQLDVKYLSANTINIIQNFLIHFQDKSKSIRLIADDMHRLSLVNKLKVWFNANIQHFDL